MLTHLGYLFDDEKGQIGSNKWDNMVLLIMCTIIPVVAVVDGPDVGSGVVTVVTVVLGPDVGSGVVTVVAVVLGPLVGSGVVTETNQIHYVQ